MIKQSFFVSNNGLYAYNRINETPYGNFDVQLVTSDYTTINGPMQVTKFPVIFFTASSFCESINDNYNRAEDLPDGLYKTIKNTIGSVKTDLITNKNLFDLLDPVKLDKHFLGITGFKAVAFLMLCKNPELYPDQIEHWEKICVEGDEMDIFLKELNNKNLPTPAEELRKLADMLERGEINTTALVYESKDGEVVTKVFGDDLKYVRAIGLFRIGERVITNLNCWKLR